MSDLLELAGTPIGVVFLEFMALAFGVGILLGCWLFFLRSLGLVTGKKPSQENLHPYRAAIHQRKERDSLLFDSALLLASIVGCLAFSGAILLVDGMPQLERHWPIGVVLVVAFGIVIKLFQRNR